MIRKSWVCDDEMLVSHIQELCSVWGADYLTAPLWKTASMLKWQMEGNIMAMDLIMMYTIL